MPVLARHDAVAQEGENDLLRDVEPVGADLASLEVEKDLGAGAEEVGDRLLELRPRLDEGVPLEVLQDPVRAVRVPRGKRRRGLDGTGELLPPVRSGVGVLRPGQPERLAAGVLQEPAPSRRITRSMKTASSLTSLEPYERCCQVPQRAG